LRTALLSAATLVGCHTDTQGLSEILSPDLTYVNFPGKRLVSGRVSRVDIDRSGHDALTEVRLLIQKQSGELVIFDPLTMKQCLVGVVAAFQPFTQTDSFKQQRRPMVALLETNAEEGRGSLGFSDWDCKVWSTGLEDAEMPSIEPWLSYPIRTTSQLGDALYAVDPWGRSVTQITDGLTSLAYNGNGWHTREGSDLVVRAYDFTPKFRWQNVPDGIAFGSGFLSPWSNSLTYLRSDGGSKYVASDACELKGADPAWGETLHMVNVGEVCWSVSFFAPCAEKTLRVYQAENGGTDSIMRQVGDPGQFVDPLFAYYYNDPAYLLDQPVALPPTAPGMVSRSHSRYVGTLYGAEIVVDSAESISVERIGDRAMLPALYAVSYEWHRQGDPLALVDYDGTVGRLVVWHPGKRTEEIASNVAEVEGGLAVVDWDGSSGALLVAMTDPPILTSIRVASLSGIVYESDGNRGAAAAWVGPAGELDVIHCSACNWNWITAVGIRPAVIAKHVQAGNFNWFGTNILGYLHDVDAGVGTLAIRFMDTADVFEQAGVSQYQFLAVPPGVLYFVDQGSKSGLWFAPLR
jgi:hypothetical protein